MAHLTFHSQKLLTYANAEMRDALLNAIMNNIRYPNAVTFYFIRLIFYFFTTPNSEAIQEQVIRYISPIPQ